MKRFSLCWIPVALALSLAWGITAGATGSFMDHTPTPPDLQTSVRSKPAPLPSPGDGTLFLDITVPTGYHIFAGSGLSVDVSPITGASLGTPAYPKGTREGDQPVLRGKVSIEIPIHLKSGIKGAIKGALKLNWQGCQDFGEKVCFLPTTDGVPFSLKVVPAKEDEHPARTAGQVQPAGPAKTEGPSSPPEKPAALQASASGSGSYQQRFSDAAKNNVPLALALAFLFGILSSLTPCVYPVIPITVAYIGSRSEGKGKGHGFLLSLAFVLGLAAVYATLGAVSAKAGAAFGSLTQTPWVGVPIALLFLVLALSMFNLFEFKTPAFITNRIERTKQNTGGGGFVGAFFIGALSGLVASPCIGPLILAILVVVAATGSVVLGFFYLFAFALGMGVLFMVIGTFSGVLASLPKSGGWMDGVRVFFGALILAAAFYFGGLYMPRPLFWTAAGLALGFISGYLLFGAQKHFFSIPLRIAGIALCAAALVGIMPLLPPAVNEMAAQSSTGTVAWHTDLDGAFATARAKDEPVLLDFRANWCVACVELEKKTWPEPDVQKILRDVIPVRMDMTDNTPHNRALQKRFGVVGLPTVILLSPGGRELGRFVAFKTPAEVISWYKETTSGAGASPK
jgi:thiol:disulfide interchange protein DsbD